MKKTLLSLLMLVVCQIGFAQVSNRVFETYKESQGVQYLDLNPEMMNMMRASNTDPDDADLLKKITSMKILMIEDKTSTTPANITAALNAMGDQGLKQLMEVKEDDTVGAIYTHTKGEVIDEFVIRATSDEGFVLMQMIGTFSQSDIANLTDMAK